MFVPSVMIVCVGKSRVKNFDCKFIFSCIEFHLIVIVLSQEDQVKSSSISQAKCEFH